MTLLFATLLPGLPTAANISAGMENVADIVFILPIFNHGLRGNMVKRATLY